MWRYVSVNRMMRLNALCVSAAESYFAARLSLCREMSRKSGNPLPNRWFRRGVVKHDTSAGWTVYGRFQHSAGVGKPVVMTQRFKNSNT